MGMKCNRCAGPCKPAQVYRLIGRYDHSYVRREPVWTCKLCAHSWAPTWIVPLLLRVKDRWHKWRGLPRVFIRHQRGFHQTWMDLF